MFSYAEFQETQRDLGQYFVEYLSELANTFSQGGYASITALDNLDIEWDQIRQLWLALLATGSPDDIALCVEIVHNLKPLLTVRIHPQDILEPLQDLLNQLEHKNLPSARLCVLFLLGEAHRLLSDYQLMRDYYAQADKLAEQLGATWYTRQIAIKLASQLTDEGYLDEALAKITWFFDDITQPINDQQAEAARVIGHIHKQQDNHDESLRYYQLALDHFSERNNLYKKMITLSNIGNIYVLKGEYKSGDQYYIRAMFINQSVKRRTSKASILYNLAFSANRSGEYKEAQYYAKQALQEAVITGEKRLILRAKNVVAIAHLRLGQYDLAVTLFREIIPDVRKNAYYVSLVHAIANLVQTWNTAEEYERALHTLQEHLPEVLQVHSNNQSRFRVVCLGVWTLAGVKATSSEYFILYGFVEAKVATYWEAPTFLANAKALQPDSARFATQPESTFTTEDALQLLAQAVKNLVHE